MAKQMNKTKPLRRATTPREPLVKWCEKAASLRRILIQDGSKRVYPYATAVQSSVAGGGRNYIMVDTEYTAPNDDVPASR